MSFAAVVFGLGIAYWRLATGWAMLAVTGSVISLILFNFTLLYFDANASDWSLHRELNKRESFALAVNTLTTAGSSGITPNSVYARTLIAFQEVVDVAGFTVLLGLVIGASRLDRPGRQHS
jgi:hypothetical protein